MKIAARVPTFQVDEMNWIAVRSGNREKQISGNRTWSTKCRPSVPSRLHFDIFWNLSTQACRGTVSPWSVLWRYQVRAVSVFIPFTTDNYKAYWIIPVLVPLIQLHYRAITVQLPYDDFIGNANWPPGVGKFLGTSVGHPDRIAKVFQSDNSRHVR